MIAVDTSALIAVLIAEPDSPALARRLSANRAVIGAPTRLEALMAAYGKLDEAGVSQLRLLMDYADIETIAWTKEMSDIAFDAFFRFGKGNHPAKLNFGDCMAYALAKSLDAPLLFKGGDFAQTDVRVAA